MNIEIKSTIKSAWALVAGSKRAFLTTLLAFVLLQILLLTIKTEFDRFIPHPMLVNVLIFILTLFIVSPLVAGLMMMGVKRAHDQVINWKNGFAYYNQIGRLFVTYLSIAALTYASFLIVALVLFSLLTLLFHFTLPTMMFRYLLLGVVIAILLIVLFALTALFSFSLILIAERKASPIKAPFRSAKMVWPHLTKMMLLVVSLILLNVVGALLLGIGLIWTLPLLYISIGKVYLQLV